MRTDVVNTISNIIFHGRILTYMNDENISRFELWWTKSSKVISLGTNKSDDGYKGNVAKNYIKLTFF